MRAAGLLLGLSACSHSFVMVTPDVPKWVPPADATFEIAVRTSGAQNPLPVAHSSVAYTDLESALSRALAADLHPRSGQFLTVELTSTEAEYVAPRLSLGMSVRATLREREGNTFIAQSQAVCRDSGFVAPEQGGHIVWECMTILARDLAGWMRGVPTPERKEGR